MIDGADLDGRPLADDELGPVCESQVAGRWVAARHLRADDLLAGCHTDLVPVERIGLHTGRLRVYNFHVLDTHSYAVGHVGVWVHNQSPQSPSSPIGGEPGNPLFKSFNDAQRNALEWLRPRGFDAITAEITISKFTGNPSGLRSTKGNIGFRIEFDSRNGAHVNVFAGKEKGPHYRFPGNQKSVDGILKLLFPGC